VSAFRRTVVQALRPPVIQKRNREEKDAFPLALGSRTRENPPMKRSGFAALVLLLVATAPLMGGTVQTGFPRAPTWVCDFFPTT
jgi:hypothetical protein